MTFADGWFVPLDPPEKMNPYESPSQDPPSTRTTPTASSESSLRDYNGETRQLLVAWLVVTLVSLLLGRQNLFGRGDVGVGFALVFMSLLSGLGFSIWSLIQIIAGIVLWKRVAQFPWGVAVNGAVFLAALTTLGFGISALGPAWLLRRLL